MTEQRGIRIKASANVATLTRLNGLAHLAREVASVLFVEEKNLNLIRDGIREELLKSFSVELFAPGVVKSVYVVDFTIDPKRGSVSAHGERIILDLALPIADQISKFSGELRDYLATRARELGANSCRLTYRPVAGKSDEFNRRFGTCTVDAADLAARDRSHLKQALKASPGRASEVEIVAFERLDREP